jgi:hypothetical protein
MAVESSTTLGSPKLGLRYLARMVSRVGVYVRVGVRWLARDRHTCAVLHEGCETARVRDFLRSR